MKTIAQLLEEKLTVQPYSAEPVPLGEATRRRLENAFRFWSGWLAVLDPLDQFHGFGGLNQPFDRGNVLRSYDQLAASSRLMKNILGVQRLTFGTYFRLRMIVEDACRRSLTESDVDVALCAVMAFVQLQLGSELDSSYGNLPPPSGTTDQRKFNDANLSDDPIEAAWELEAWHDNGEHLGRSEYRRMMWSRAWCEIFEDRAKFEQQFPGAGDRHDHIVRAFGPVLDRLDPLLDDRVLGTMVGWIRPLLAAPFEEGLLTGRQVAAAA